ncbi:hypothetical protein ACFVAF_25280 [Streptomyces sp. NPDC057596]|uniref:hypothetical protein n=1 Tax=Streptomyces sp. NPDC057596 TaxID=3346178 RepID=UPI003676614A
MALCRDCRKPIPCHCHVSPPVEIRPGVYLVTEPHPRIPAPSRVADRVTGE